MEPKIIEVPAFKVAGVQTYGSAMSGDFSKMWALLMDRNLELPNRFGPCGAYGICSYIEMPSDDFKLFYMAAVKVDSFDELPPNAVGKVIPANTYAVFTHKGPLDETLKDSFHRAYEWLGNSTEYIRAAPYDYEWYGEDFNGPQNPDSILEIFVPIKKAESSSGK